MGRPWWIEIAGRLDLEVEALRKICSEVAIYKQDEDSGHLGINVVFEFNGAQYPLRAEFPALYPFTRPMVYAEANLFRWHQNPYGKNLCLLGRTAENWSPSYTLAQHLSEQMPKLIESNDTQDQNKAADLEELQAEPFTVFLQYQINSSMLVLQDLPPTGRSKGTFLAGCLPFDGTFRGAILGLRDDQSKQLIGTSDAVSAAMQFTKEIHGKWYRMGSKPPTASAQDFLRHIEASHPEVRTRNWTTHRDKKFEVIGVLMPEEQGWRTAGESMLFLIVQEHKSPSGKKSTTAEFVRTYRSDQATLSARVPEMAGLQKKRILLAGAGSLGALCALEFARNGMGRMNLVDGDLVEAGNSVRWSLGVASAGFAKVIALQKHIVANHPFTQVAVCPVDIGSEAYTLEIERQLFEQVDLVFDATAERGISYLLSERARTLGIPYISVTSTLGNWGGIVLKLAPERPSPCWICLSKHWVDGALPIPATGPEARVQVGGCASPTFTGAYMDSSEAGLMAVRLAVSLLSSQYPSYDWDYAAVSMREADGKGIPPLWRTASLTKHPDCENHS
jgi:molybdopterin/thiamine biosynthesis adenylyltransferase/ubiquitin-protein ligase